MYRMDVGLALSQAAQAKAAANIGHRDRRKAPLKESVLTTWRGILKRLQRRARAGLLPTVDGNYCVHLTNQEIATASGASVRTVIRHRALLVAHGLILKEVFHGSHHPVEMVIPGRYLGIVQPLQADQATGRLDDLIARAEAAEAAEALSSGDKMSPLPEEEEKNITNGECRKCAPGDAPGQRGGVECADGAASDHGPDGKEHGRQAGHGGGGAARASGRAGAGGPPDTPPGGDETLAGLLWAFARLTLWKGAPITPRQEALARRHIRALYEAAPPKEHALWHERFVGMVAAAGDYVRRKPGRYVQSPDRFFSPENRAGFRGCWPWYLKTENARKAARQERELHDAWRIWKKNEAAPPSRQRDRLEVWRELTDKVARIGRQDLLDLWMATFVGGGHG